MSFRRQRGVALITALLIMALLAILGLTLSADNAMDVRRTSTLLFHEEGTLAALGAENWVASILRDDLTDSSTDHLGELWASELPVLPIESDTIQGAIQGEIVDLQGRFNINSLVDDSGRRDQAAAERFERLLGVLDLDTRLVGTVVDWLDADQQPGFPDGAEDPIYTSRTPQYRSADQRLVSVSELLAVDGMDKESFDTLAPHIAALPGTATVNVNTASAAVLASLDDGLSLQNVESMLADREDGGFSDYENYFRALVAPEVLPLLGDSSSYFQLKVVVQIATVRITYFSLLYRDPNSGVTTPILRSFGAF